MELLRVRLADEEYEALAKLCAEQLRPLPDQARILIRQELRKQGLLQIETPAGATTGAR